MNDLVIPLGTGSHWQNNELRYSLRGIEKHVRNLCNVVIVGELPDWARNVVHIPSEEVATHGHERRIVEKFLAASRSPLVSENFLMWNDDYFAVQDISATACPYFYFATLEIAALKRRKNDGYGHSIRNSWKALADAGRPIRYFDIHLPMIYNKRRFVEVMERHDWEIPNGYVIKSLYANSIDISEDQLKEVPDLKFHGTYSLDNIRKNIKGRPLFSVSDAGLTNTMKDFIHSLYREKSKYEA